MRKLKLNELNRLSTNDFKDAKKNDIIVILDNVRSAMNVGSVFRTCDAFLIDKLFLCGITAKPPHREIEKTALGATETVAWQHEENTLQLIEKLKQENYIIIAVEQAENSTFLHELNVDKNQKYALIFGNEVEGVSDEVIKNCDVCLEVPQFGSKHSFNIGVCTGIVLWDLVSKINLYA